MLVAVIAMICSMAANAKTINPKDYGLFEAKSGQGRFEVLMRCHSDAVERGYDISYAGIKVIEIEIPTRAKSIPLPDKTDFAGVKIFVDNTDRDYVLFKMLNKVKEVQVSGEDVDGKIYLKSELPKKGKQLLVVEDKNFWVHERLGYKGGLSHARTFSL